MDITTGTKESKTILLSFFGFDFFSFFVLCSMWDLSLLRMEPMPPAVEAQSLTAGPPGKSLFSFRKAHFKVLGQFRVLSDIQN